MPDAMVSGSGLLSPTRRPHPVPPGLILVTSAVRAAPPPSRLAYVGTATRAIVASSAAPDRAEPFETTVPSVTRPTAGRVARLRSLSGLTTSQVGRLMGVSRRSIHHWIGGATMTRANEERLARLLEMVQGLPGSPDERRAALLDSSKGVSLFHRLLDERVQSTSIHDAALTTRERLGS